MNVYLCGQKFFGMMALQLFLKEGFQVVGVSSPAWRNVKLRLADGGDTDIWDRLRAEAWRYGVPWMESGALRASNLPEGTDIIVAAHSHDFIGQATRRKARYGALGYHPSLLPLHRGRDAIRWALHMHERITGGTVFWLNEVVDGGPIAAQAFCHIRPGDTPDSLWRRELQPIGLRLLLSILRILRTEPFLPSFPQDEALATWEPAFDAPRLRRPDLTQLGGSLNGKRVMSDPDAIREGYAILLGETGTNPSKP